MLRRGDAKQTTGDCLGLMVLSSMILAVLVMIGGNKQDTGPFVEVENTVKFLCTGAAGICSQESNMNCVNGGIIVVVEA